MMGKDANFGSGQEGRNLYSSFVERLKFDFGRFKRGAWNRFWNVLLWKDTQVWENKVLMIRGVRGLEDDWECSKKFMDVVNIN
jgi:hypothetical protein